MSVTALAMQTPQVVYASLMATRQGDPVEVTLARILASWSLGLGSMPDWLGLGKSAFYHMMQDHFPGYDVVSLSNPGRPLDWQRSDEMADLRKLLMKNRTSNNQSEARMADIVIAGCLGENHLWQDLGLWNRSELSGLMLENFRPLAVRNDQDMKWKKFLYKQLCDAEGVTTCRAPSCEVCADYPYCFGPEE